MTGFVLFLVGGVILAIGLTCRARALRRRRMSSRASLSLDEWGERFFPHEPEKWPIARKVVSDLGLALGIDPAQVVPEDDLALLSSTGSAFLDCMIEDREDCGIVLDKYIHEYGRCKSDAALVLGARSVRELIEVVYRLELLK